MSNTENAPAASGIDRNSEWVPEGDAPQAQADLGQPSSPALPIEPVDSPEANPEKKKQEPLVEARVLVECSFGAVNDVVLVTKKVLKNSAELDGDAGAVAYAKSLAVK